MMDSARAAGHDGSDLSSLAWVQDELRRSLDAAHKSLRRFVKEQDAVGASDVDVVDPSVLRGARAQIHQGAGALELVGMPEAALLLRASEAAVQRYIGKPHKLTALAVDDIERASFALLDYVGRLLGGKPVSPLSLFPQYRALQDLAGAERIHPADLWPADWRWLVLPADAKVGPIPADEDARAMFEAQLLRTMRGSDAQVTAAGMSDLCAGLGAASTHPHVATLWKLAAAMFEAQALGLLGFDVYSKRVASRLMAQFKSLERNQGEVSERLATDLLFFCAQSASPGDGRHAPRLAAVRAAYGLARHVPGDYNQSVLGRHDPAWIAQARKRVTTAKETWSAVAGGELHRLPGLAEQFALVGESLKRLFPHGESIAAELQHSATATQQAGATPPPTLAMEVATSVLYVEAAHDDADFDDPAQAERVRRLAARVEAARRGEPPTPLEPWMEELYRRVSDRQTMGSVVQELRAALSESEKLIDQFFRNPADRQVLIPVPGQLSAMRGVLSVLGMDQASAALLRMRDEVDTLSNTEIDPGGAQAAAVFDRLAGNLGALGFLIDMLSVQPAMAKSLFTWDAAQGTLDPLMGRGAQRGATPAPPPPVEPRLIEQAQNLARSAGNADVPFAMISLELDRLTDEAQAAHQPELAQTLEQMRTGLADAGAEAQHSVRGELSEALVDFVNSATMPIGLDEAPPARVPLAPPAPPSTEPPELAEDDEMRGVFLEEAREVIADASAARNQLVELPGAVGLLTTVRRAFHTLKGSSRMVGLKAFGEAAWVCEQIYNTQLADQRAAEPRLLAFTGWVLGYLGEWVEQIAARATIDHDAKTVQAAAERLAETAEGTPALAEAPAMQPADAAPEYLAVGEATETLTASAFAVMSMLEPLRLPPGLPTAADLDLSLPPADERSAIASAAAQAQPPVAELDFELDLAALSLPDGAPMAAPAPAPAPMPERAPDFDSEATIPMPMLPEVAELPPEPERIEPVALDFELPEVVATAAPAEADEEFKLVGPLRVAIPLFGIFLNEADELSRRLATELAEWAIERERPVGDSAVALAHSLAGSSATVGFADLSALARSLEHALTHSNTLGRGTLDDGRVFVDVADEIRRLLHQFAAGFLHRPEAALLQRLAELDVELARRLEAAAAEPAIERTDVMPRLPEPVPEPRPEPLAARTDFAPSSTHASLDTQFDALGVAQLRALEALAPEVARVTPGGTADARLDSDEDIDAVDAVDAELFPFFEEEAQDLLPQLATGLRDWARRPTEAGGAAGCMRTLHTFKGGARLAGAMRLGEMAHRLETRIEHLLAAAAVASADVDELLARSDALTAAFEALRMRDAEAYAEASAVAERQAEVAEATVVVEPPVQAPVVVEVAPPAPPLAEASQPVAAPAPARAPAAAATPIDWSRFAGTEPAERRAGDRAAPVAQGAVRVRVPLLDRLVNHAGEVSITRSRIGANVASLKGSLGDLTENLDRLRQQLRDIELQAETQMASRLEAAKAEGQSFDPLEFDRFTRFQELTRMMAESVNDVATVQRTLQRSIDGAEDELAAQARLTRDLQDDLLRTRMVEFEGLSDRLYRVVRLAAKETGKLVRLDIVGGSIEADRGVLDRMTAAFEHLLRNCVAHGIELPEARAAAGKDASGRIVVAVTHEGNEVGVEFRDDGRGLDLPRIRERAVAVGLIDPGHAASDAELANLIFLPGFTTAESVTELAGRGVGMDVVKNEVSAIGGRVETATAVGQGTAFKLILPLTTAVTQVVMVRVGEVNVAIPSTLVEIVRRASQAEITEGYATGGYRFGERVLPYFWLGALLQTSPRALEATGRMRTVLVVRSAQQRVAIHVDEVLGNQEVVVKNLGPQLSRMPGLAGMTLLASGAVALIYNPVALATLYGDAARAATDAAFAAPAAAVPVPAAPSGAPLAPLVLVVDDSLTVRRVTQRLLAREGYRVVLAKDGLDALERLAEELPQVVLSDIEMPRMDGFDLVRNLRGDARMAGLPVIMITSRIAAKHREYAAELGVDHYLGKPYAEDDLLSLVARYARAQVSSVT